MRGCQLDHVDVVDGDPMEARVHQGLHVRHVDTKVVRTVPAVCPLLCPLNVRSMSALCPPCVRSLAAP